MIKFYRVTNPTGDLTEIDVFNSKDQLGFLVFSVEGLGPPKANVNGIVGPTLDGQEVNSVVIDTRQILVTLVVQKGLVDEETAKQTIYDFFPIGEEIVFEVETDRKHVNVRAIVEDNTMNQYAQNENAAISLLCPDPWFVDLLRQNVIVAGDGVTDMFSFPFGNESLYDNLLAFGEIQSFPVHYMLYPGEVKTGVNMIMSINGFVEDITISNSNGSQVMNLDLSGAEVYFGSPPQAGDQIHINTKPKQKSIYYVRNDVFFDMLNGVDISSDWLELRKGVNVISIVAVTGQELIDTEIQFYPLREGV